MSDARQPGSSKTFVAKTLASVGEIGTLPLVAVRIMDLVANENTQRSDLRDLIQYDPALSAKLLKVSNSAFYGLPGQIATIDRALIVLGIKEVKSIAMAVSLAKMFGGPAHPGLFDIAQLWTHSLGVAVAGRALAQLSTCPPSPDELFLAGLIHDMGLIIERQAFPRELGELCSLRATGDGDLLDLERNLIGATHQEFGLAMTTKWRFPQDLRLAAGFHHEPAMVPEENRPLVALVHCANHLCISENVGVVLEDPEKELSPQWIETAGLADADFDSIRERLPEDVRAIEETLSR